MGFFIFYLLLDFLTVELLKIHKAGFRHQILEVGRWLLGLLHSISPGYFISGLSLDAAEIKVGKGVSD